MFIFGKLVPALCLRAVIPVQMARRGGAGDAGFNAPRTERANGPKRGDNRMRAFNTRGGLSYLVRRAH